LNPQDRSIADLRLQESRQPIDAGGVGTSDRAHLDDLAVDELDPVVFAQHTALGHPMIFVSREQPPLKVGSHLMASCRKGASAGRSYHPEKDEIPHASVKTHDAIRSTKPRQSADR